MKGRNEEQGMALVIAIMVTLFLLSIGLAFFTYSQKSIVDTNCSIGKRLGTMVAEAGAERALWQIQQILDTGGTVTIGNLFGDYSNLYREHRDSESANIYGSSSVGMGTYTKYAVKTEWEQENKILAVYSLGVLRVANSLAGKSTTLIEGGKILIKVGSRKQGFDNIAVGSNGDLIFSDNSQRQVTGDGDGDGVSIVSNGTISMNAQSIGSSAINDKWIDGNTDNIAVKPLTIITTQQVTGLPGAGITKDVNGSYSIGTKPVIIKNGVDSASLPKLPDLDLSQYNVAEGGYQGPDYVYDSTLATPDIVENNAGRVRKNWISRSDVIESPANGMVTFWGTRIKPTEDDIVGYLNRVYSADIPANDNDPDDKRSDHQNKINGFVNAAFYDVNGDGFTTIYVGQGGPNLRMLPYQCSAGDAVSIINGAKALIVSQGVGTNFNQTDNPLNEYGFATLNGHPSAGTGFGVDSIKNSNVGIEIRGTIVGVNYEFVSGQRTPGDDQHMVLIDQITNNPVEGHLGGDGSVVKEGNNCVQSAERGSLSLLADKDLILSSAGVSSALGDSSGEGKDPRDIFKGFLYSKNDITIQIDLCLLGSIIGVNKVNMPDMKALNESLGGSASDGGAFNLHFINAENYLPKEKCPTKVSRDIKIVSWESGKIKI